MALKIDFFPPGELKPYAGNARTHSPEQLAQIRASIEEFGFTNPILIDADRGVIAGHGRLSAALSLGMDSVPCIILAHLTDAQKRALVIADNRLALSAGWDLDVLAFELVQLADDGFDLGKTGMDTDEISRLLGRVTANAGLTDPEDAPSLEAVAVSQPTDVWLLGEHRVMCGDARVLTCMERLVGADEHVDLWLTDPPYGVAYAGGAAGKRRAIANDALAADQLREFLTEAFKVAAQVLRPGASFYIWHPDGAMATQFRLACAAVPWTIRQTLVWLKSSASLGRQDYQWVHEPCLYGWAEDDARLYDAEHVPCLYGWQDGAGHAWNNDRKQTTVLRFDRPAKSEEHPTMKPVAMFEYQMRNSTSPGAVVLDSFGGSGTTLIAAEHCGRVARVMELDPLYVDVIVRRWQAFTGGAAVRERDGISFNEAAEAALEATA